MFTRRDLFISLAATPLAPFSLAFQKPAGLEEFVVKPYLQMGDGKLAQESLRVMWHTKLEDAPSVWQVQWRAHGNSIWRQTIAADSQLIRLKGTQPEFRYVYTEEEARQQEVTGRRLPLDPKHQAPVSEIPPHRIYTASLGGLSPGGEFDYRLIRNGKEVFAATGKARCAPHHSFRVAVYGDIGYNTPAQRRVANQVYRQAPDFVAIPGDVVYLTGRVSEYREYFFPIQNSDTASPETGAPLLRSRLTMPGLGWHDVPVGSHDSLAYFMYWGLPQNGPEIRVGDPNAIPLQRETPSGQAILQAIGDKFPQRANYSFDYGPSHWTVIDTLAHADWNDVVLRDWLRTDLRSARSKPWRFVLCYLPPFHSGKDYNWQKMRIVADIFQEEKVAIVFSGFHHSYQRSYPLRFQLNAKVLGPVTVCDTVLPGSFQLDHRFDGARVTHPEGVIYITTGGGGWVMLNPEQTDNPPTWQTFTAKFKAAERSFTVMDVESSRLELKQISEHGQVLDNFVVTT